MVLEELNEYITSLDDIDKRIIDQRIAEKGIENYLSQQLVYLDCSRIIKDMRMMQTIGYPYQREISSYLYALETVAGNDFDFYVTVILVIVFIVCVAWGIIQWLIGQF